MDTVHYATEYKKSLMIDEKSISNYAKVRLKDYSETPFALTYEFVSAVKELPDTYNEKEYITFIRNWGTVSSIVAFT